MRLALVVEYDGTEYSGFQYQANAPSIQEELEKAVAKLTREKVRVSGAGRTDAGVHAAGQIVAFDTSADYGPEQFVNALNHHLPDDIAVREAYEVESGFDPRRMALSRKYVYTILRAAVRSPLHRRNTYRISSGLNVGEMCAAARLFVGIHDFRRFSGPLESPEASTVREIFDAGVRESGSRIEFHVEGNAFLPHQVRRMSGALVDVGLGRMDAAEVEKMIGGEETKATARSLPAQGLCLVEVKYAGFPPGSVKEQ
jgi:tRNA pseudouridine38-40 synthase